MTAADENGVDHDELIRTLSFGTRASLPVDQMTRVAELHRGGRAADWAIAEAEHLGIPLAFVLADLDDFRSIKLRFGEPVSDDVLVAVSAVFVALSRPDDIVLRAGGDKFGVLMFDVDLDTAAAWAERTRVGLGHVVMPEMLDDVSASFGVAQALPGDDAASLEIRAIEALLRAKRNGKNQVQIAR